MSEDQKTVRVFARLRPTENFAYNNINIQPDGKTVDIHVDGGTAKGGFVNNQTTDWSFALDGVLHDTSQDLLYELSSRNVVKRAFHGYNGTIMCYGQTGSGKTFTMTGANESFQNRGIIPRAIQQVFREISTMPDYAINVKISYLEIYNETLFDLLSPTQTSPTGQGMTILEDELGIKVNGLSQHIANNEEEALNLLFEGETSRAIAAHQMNKHSSRSHVIFTIHIETRSRTESSSAYTVSKLNFVDLAGSERLGKTHSSGRTQSEATFINKSLTFLEQTIIAITDRKRDHIPFRQSKLTHVLKDSIGGNCYTVMFANMWGEAAHLEETISTLRFGMRMMRVPIAAAVNQVTDPGAMVKQLEKEVRTLKQELSMHDTLNNRTNSYDVMSDGQLAEVQRQVANYLNGAADGIDIVNVRQIKTVFGVFKTMFKTMEKDIEARLKEKYELAEKSAESGGAQQPAAAARRGSTLPPPPPGSAAAANQVGELDGAGGVGVGVADPARKASESSVVAQKKAAAAAQRKKAAAAGKSPRSSRDASPAPQSPENQPTTAAGSERAATPPPRHVAFEAFKAEDGAQLNRILNDNKEMLKSKLSESREVANRINELKRQIDRTRDEINEVAGQRENQGGFPVGGEERVLDESEYHLILRLKGLKKEYREQYSELQRVRSETGYCQRLVDQCRQRLISDFDTWYLQSYLGPNVDFTPTVETNYGMSQMANVHSINEDEGEKMERQQTNIMMQDPDSYNYHKAKRNTIRKLNAEKSAEQVEPHSGLIVPPKKPTQMILTAEY